MKLRVHAALEPPRMLTWNDLVEAAESADAVIAIARDFLATWDPWEGAALPAACRPPHHLVAPEDIVEYAFVLAQHDREPGADGAGLHRMAQFFSNASQRIAILLSAAPVPSAENDPGA